MRAVCRAQPSHAYMAFKLLIRVDEFPSVCVSSALFSLSLSLCFYHLLGGRVLLLHGNISLGSGKNANTCICPVLCSLHNDITYTDLFLSPKHPAEWLADHSSFPAKQ